MGFPIPNPISVAKAGIDKAGDIGSDLRDGAEAVVSTVSTGTEIAFDSTANFVRFQADVTRAGLERTWEGTRNAASGAGDFFGDIFDRATHPGDPNPPAAQGLEFSESKGASDLAYNANAGEVYTFHDGGQWEVVEVSDDPNSGFRAIALRSTDPEDDRVIVAFAGSGKLNDWDDNLMQGAGLVPEQYEQAVAFAEKWKTAEGADNVRLTGHSLGGGLASYAAIETDLHATGINASPISLNNLQFDFGDFTRITQYYVPGEALSVVNNVNPLDVRPGVNIAVRGQDSILDPRSIGTNHALDNVAPDIKPPVKN